MGRHRVSRRLSLWLPVALQLSAIFVASSVPNLRQLPGGVSDHFGHFVGYALLGALLLRARSGASWDGVRLGAAAWAWALSTIYGISDEWHQTFVPGRTAAIDDVVADTLGAASAVFLLVVVAAVGRAGARDRAV